MNASNDNEEARVYIIEGPFHNPDWQMHKLNPDIYPGPQDKWAYKIDGMTFTAPTQARARQMMDQPERHDFALGYKPLEWDPCT